MLTVASGEGFVQLFWVWATGLVAWSIVLAWTYRRTRPSWGPGPSIRSPRQSVRAERGKAGSTYAVRDLTVDAALAPLEGVVDTVVPAAHDRSGM